MGHSAFGHSSVNGAKREPAPAASTTPAILISVQPRQWTNQRQPQTLQIAVFLLYADAALAVLFGQIFSVFGLLLAVGSAVAGYQIANDKRWGYRLGVAVAGFLLIFLILDNLAAGPDLFFLVNLIFPLALFAALVHPVSREYQRIWFE
jgi:hypothetical protein